MSTVKISFSVVDQIPVICLEETTGIVSTILFTTRPLSAGLIIVSVLMDDTVSLFSIFPQLVRIPRISNIVVWCKNLGIIGFKIVTLLMWVLDCFYEMKMIFYLVTW